MIVFGFARHFTTHDRSLLKPAVIEKIAMDAAARSLAEALVREMRVEKIEFDPNLPQDEQVVRPGEIQYRFKAKVEAD